MPICRFATHAAALLVLAATACGAGATPESSNAIPSQSGAYLAHYTLDPDPPVTGENKLALSIAKAGGAAVPGAELVVTPWMPTMGHGTPVTPTVETLGGGDYRVSHLDYTMPGSWEVRIELTDGAVTDQFALDLDVH
jgi:hypothetical protein